MRGKTYSLEEISIKLARVEELIAAGASVQDAARQMGVHYTTIYLWRRRLPNSAGVKGFRRIKRRNADDARLRTNYTLTEICAMMTRAESNLSRVANTSLNFPTAS